MCVFFEVSYHLCNSIGLPKTCQYDVNSALQFMNKVLYAREGAKGIMDRTFEDLPWQIRVEVDGVEIEVPEVCKHVSFPIFLKSMLQ